MWSSQHLLSLSAGFFQFLVCYLNLSQGITHHRELYLVASIALSQLLSMLLLHLINGDCLFQ